MQTLLRGPQITRARPTPVCTDQVDNETVQLQQRLCNRLQGACRHEGVPAHCESCTCSVFTRLLHGAIRNSRPDAEGRISPSRCSQSCAAWGCSHFLHRANIKSEYTTCGDRLGSSFLRASRAHALRYLAANIVLDWTHVQSCEHRRVKINVPKYVETLAGAYCTQYSNGGQCGDGLFGGGSSAGKRACSRTTDRCAVRTQQTGSPHH